MCMERDDLGELMLNWHSSMGDPIYAVGSYYVSGKVYPDAEVVRRALHNLTMDLKKQKSILAEQHNKLSHAEEMDTASNVADLEEIVLYLGHYLEKDYKM